MQLFCFYHSEIIGLLGVRKIDIRVNNRFWKKADFFCLQHNQGQSSKHTFDIQSTKFRKKKEFLRENSVDKVVILRLGLASMKSAAG